MVGLVYFHLQIIMSRLETSVIQILRLGLEILAGWMIVSEDMVLMRFDTFKVLRSPEIVQVALHILIILKVIFMPIHQSLIIVSALIHCIGKIRMLLRNPNLFLQPLFLIMQFAQPILKHESFLLFLLHVQFLLELAWAV